MHEKKTKIHAWPMQAEAIAGETTTLNPKPQTLNPNPVLQTRVFSNLPRDWESIYYWGLNDVLYYLGGPSYNYSIICIIMGPKTLF